VSLPPGPADGVLAQTFRMHRDPLGFLSEARAKFGDVFTIRLATARPVVVVAVTEEIPRIVEVTRAGEARRRILPMASPRSIFGGDREQHRAARGRVAAAFTPDAIAARQGAIAAIAAAHVDDWPARGPVRMLPRMRALVDEAFTRVWLGVSDDARVAAVTTAIRRMLWTPGNPPMTIPGEGDGLLGALGTALFKRRQAPLAKLLAEEFQQRRHGDDVIALMRRALPDAPSAALVDELIPLIMAAQEPAASSLAWLFDRLAHTREPFSDDLVHETWRERPAAAASLRRLPEPVTVAGHTLPAGVTVMVPIALAQRDPRVYMPFGGGPRRCLGEHLATAYANVVVPAVLERRRLRPLLREREPMVLRGTILVPRFSAAMMLSAP
jgi:cytochrome P450